MAKLEDIAVIVAENDHEKYVDTILATIEEAAKKRGSGIRRHFIEA